MAKPLVTDYVVNVKIKNANHPPTATALGNMIREKLRYDGYEVTVRTKVVKDEAPVTEDV